MKTSINIKKNELKKLEKRIDKFQNKDLKRIKANITNWLSYDSREEALNQVKNKLNWKNKFPKSAIWVEKATVEKPTAYLNINNKSWTFSVLGHHFLGGARNNKKLELFLKRNGFINEDDFLIAPKNNQNVRKVAFMILNDFRKKEFSRFFVLNKAPQNKRGIYAKAIAKNIGDKNNLKWDTRRAIMLFKLVRKPHYKKIFDLKTIVDKKFSEKGSQYVEKALKQMDKKP